MTSVAGGLGRPLTRFETAAKHYPPADILDRSFEVRRTEGVGSSGSTPSLLIGPMSGATIAHHETTERRDEMSDTEHVEEGRAPDRSHRLRPAARSLRPRVPRWNVARHRRPPAPASTDGLDLEAIALASRLIGRELDHDDPMGGHYTLEVTSPGLERSLRTPAHFQRSIGKTVALRLRDIVTPRASAASAACRVCSSPPTIRQPRSNSTMPRRPSAPCPYDKIDSAKTVFEWGPAPKPGKQHRTRRRQARRQRHRK